jgi:rare lipoprotein A
MNKNLIFAISIFVFFLQSCSSLYEDQSYSGHYKVGQPYKVNNVQYHPKEVMSYEAVGLASWYGPGFHGKTTANGEVFNQRKLTAAHNTLPLPSLVQVTNLQNKKSIIVKVNDRGPFARNKKSRIIDLSEKAAELLGMKNSGIAVVKVTLLHQETAKLHQKLKLLKSPFKHREEVVS